MVSVDELKGKFIGYKGGQRTQHSKYALIRLEGVDGRSETATYIGRKVVWHSTSGGRSIGKVVGVHGRGDVLKVRFRKGLPGEAVGTDVVLI